MRHLRFPRIQEPQTSPIASDGAIRDSRRSHLNESDLRRLQRLRFTSGELSASGLSGEHRSRHRGPSPEFADYKAYSHGDDFRRIDWNSYARLDQLFIKESEVPTEREVHIFIDASPSMNWSSQPQIATKLDVARKLASMLGYIALWHFDRVSIQPLGTDAFGEFGPVQGRSNTLRMFHYCEQVAPVRDARDAESIARHIQRKKRPGRLIILSDFNWIDPQALRELLLRAATRRWQTTLVLLEDPDEIDPSAMFDEADYLELENVANNDRLHVSGATGSIENYRRTRQKWLGEIADMATLPGVTTTTIATDAADSMQILSNLIDLNVIRR